MAKLKNLAKYSGIALLLTNFSSCSFQKLIPHHLTSNLTYSHNIVKPNIRINIDHTRDKAPIESIVNELENVPDEIQLFCNNAGGIIEIYDKPMKDHPLFNCSKRLRKGGSNFFGFYDIDSKTAVVPYSTKEIKKSNVLFETSERVALHEYGHLIDYLMGRPSQSQPFVEVFKPYIFFAKRNFVSKFLFRQNEFNSSQAEECFANHFTFFYASGNSRRELHEFNLDITKYFANLETQLVQQGN